MSDLVIYLVIGAITLIGLIFGALLGFASVKLKVEADPIVDKIDAVLPQSQCGQCGYPGCRPYAEAIANGDEITKCVPGGAATVVKIADLLGVEPPALDGIEEPVPQVAFIDEAMCIGCTKCIQACPVDAIIGTNKFMHTIVADICTGCTLCVDPCPTNCITMIDIKPTQQRWNWRFDPDLVIPVLNTTELEKKWVVGKTASLPTDTQQTQGEANE